MPFIMSDCLFCKILAGEIPAKKVAEGDGWFAFEDINPQASTHVLVIPKVHVANFTETHDVAVQSAVWSGVQAVAAQRGLSDYRVVVNNGAGAGQTVFHLHVHVLGGRPFAWPPG